MSKRLRVKIGDRWYSVEVGDVTSSPVQVLVDGEPVEVQLEQIARPDSQSRPNPQSDPAPVAEAGVTRTPSAVKVFRSPMPGVILSVSVKEGDQVVTGDEVCVLEAMKMQQSLRADWTGIVRVVHVRPGQQVLDGDPIVELA